MARLLPIIRVKRWELDERRRELVALQELRAKCDQELIDLSSEVQSESACTGLDPAAYQFGAYLQGIKLKEQAIHIRIEELEQALEAKQAEVAEAFEGVKRFEIVLERQQQAEKKKLAAMEQQELDEIGLRATGGPATAAI